MGWTKVIVSGSDAELNSLKVTTVVSGSVFSGSFVGDGSQLTGLPSGGTTSNDFTMTFLLGGL